MSLGITHPKKQGYLQAFHFGDIELKGIFPFSKRSVISFQAEADIKGFIAYVREQLIRESNRLGEERTKKLLDFASKLRSKEIELQ